MPSRRFKKSLGNTSLTSHAKKLGYARDLADPIVDQYMGFAEDMVVQEIARKVELLLKHYNADGDFERGFVNLAMDWVPGLQVETKTPSPRQQRRNLLFELVDEIDEMLSQNKTWKRNRAFKEFERRHLRDPQWAIRLKKAGPRYIDGLYREGKLIRDLTPAQRAEREIFGPFPKYTRDAARKSFDATLKRYLKS